MRRGQGEPVHLRHVHVEDRQVEPLARGEPAQRLARRLGVARRHAPLGGLQREDAAIGGVVVDHQDSLALQLGLDADEFAAPAGRQIGDLGARS